MAVEGTGVLPEPSPERRYLSIMFVDVVGFTRLSEEIDPEDLLSIQRRYRQLALGVTERFGGFVGDFAGDGVLAYFGYPTARGNDAERAVRAALETILQLGRMDFPLSDGRTRKLQARVGVHTGLVVVGRESVRARQTPLGVVGAAVNIAARLQHEAPPSGVVITRETKGLVEDLFDFAPLGVRALKGLTQSIEVFRVIGARTVAAAGKGSPRGKAATMIGREFALAQVLARWRSVCNTRESQIIEIVGDAGVGKSRLVNEFCSHPATNGVGLVQIHCHELFANTPLYPVGNYLWKRIGLAIEDDDETRRRKLGDFLREFGLDSGPNTLILASLPGLGHASPSIESIAPTPHLFKRARFGLIAEAFHRLARSKPTILVIEDAHWLDPSTAELLNEIAHGRRDEPYLIVVTRRSFPKGPSAPEPDEMIRLEQLSRLDCLALAMSLNGAQGLPADAIRDAAEAAEGVPLFVEQLVRSLVESPAQEISRNRKGASLPLQLAELMSERLDRLPGCRRIVQAAACLGRSFRPEFLSALLDEAPAALAGPLTSLVEAEILLPKRHGLEIRYEFRHALIQRMADESMVERERRALHARTIALLDKEGDHKATPEMLAHHQTEAGLHGDAIASWIEAGRTAAGQSAHPETIDHLRKALSLLDRVPDEALRRNLELKTLAVMIGSLTITQGATSFELSALCARGLELARDLPTPMVFPFIFGQFTFANCRGRLADATASADMFVSLAEQMRYDAGRVIGHRLKGMLALGNGQLVEAKAHLQRAISLHEAERDARSTSTYGQNAHLHSLALLSQTLFCLGDVQAALRIGREALLALDALSHPHSSAIVRSYVGGNVFGFCGATDHLLRQARKVVAVSEQHDLPGFRPHGLGFLGWGLAQKGEYEEGIVLMTSAVKAFDAMEYTLGVCAHLVNLADAQRRVGRLEEAKAASARAIEIISSSGNAWAEAEILRVDALIEADRSASGRRDAASRLWFAAERARAIGSPVFERRCLLSLVEVGGDPDILRKARERLGALAPFDHLPELVDAVMEDAPVPA